jgi:hypothetical protein
MALLRREDRSPSYSVVVPVTSFGLWTVLGMLETERQKECEEANSVPMGSCPGTAVEPAQELVAGLGDRPV